MKMHAHDFAALRTAIEATPDKSEAYKRAGLSHMRFRWDALHASGYPLTPLYGYLHDSHVDTALRTIMGADYPEDS